MRSKRPRAPKAGLDQLALSRLFASFWLPLPSGERVAMRDSSLPSPLSLWERAGERDSSFYFIIFPLRSIYDHDHETH